MRKIIHFLSFLVILAAGISCNKEIPGPAGNDGEYELGAEMCTATFKLNVKRQPKTKARAIGALDDESIDRIDVYEYNCGRQTYWDCLPVHYVLTAAELESGVFHVQNPTNAKKGYLFYANLSPAIADKIANTYGNRLYNVNIRSIDFYDGTYGVPMGGTKYVYFNADQTVDVSLERFFYRVDVGEIVADFEDESWMGKDVFVKNIALINTAAIVTMGGDYLSYLEPDYIDNAIFGPQKTTTEDQPFFGGLEVIRNGYRLEDGTSYSCWNPSTDATVSCSFLMNKNKNVASGVLNITATDVWLTNTVQSYDNSLGEGRICSSTNPSQSHTLTVNKSLYGMKGCVPYGYYGVLSTSSNQNAFPKLVVEISVDGRSYFYPILMYYPMHNVAYQISRITLKREGSDYSNFFEIKIAAEVEISVADWEETEIGNINVGYTDDTGSAIY